jgi:transposase
MERGGRVVARIVPGTKAATLMPHVIARVMPNSMVFTDEALAYDPLTRMGYGHKRVHLIGRCYRSAWSITISHTID